MKKTFLILFCAIASAFTVRAQDMGKLQSPVLHQQSFQLTAGTQGIGGEFIYGFSQKLALRSGLSFVPLTMNNAFPVSGFNSDNKLTANFSNIHFLADFTPFRNTSFLRIVGGAAYFMQAKGNFAIQPTGNYKYGDIVLTPGETGNLNMNTSWSGVAPYLGLGFVRLFPRHFFNVNLDLGTYYMPAPRTSVVGTGLLDGNSSQNDQFRKNMSSYRFLPVAQLNFSFKL